MEDPTGRSPNPELFAASLSAGPVEAGFSQRAAFFVAFFGGPFAALGFQAWNAQLWGRLARDLPLVIVGFLLTAATLSGLVLWASQPASGGSGVPRDVRLLSRALALVLWGIFALRHRALHRAQALSGLKPRSPWLPGIACAIGNFLIVGALVAATRLVGDPR
jgi:hypothetical protein